MTDAMEANPVREKLARGGSAYGTMAFEFFTPGLARILGQAGAEFVLLDMEHSGAGIDTMKQQIACARASGVAALVRVPGRHYHLVAPVLDAGALGIMVPMVETGAQAQEIARWCRYRPDGVRGLAFNVAHDGYSGGDPVAKMKAANERTLVIALVESANGIDAIDAVLSVPGIDVGWLGHFDLTDSMGIPAQFDHPRFLAAVDRFLDSCRRHGKAPGILAGSVASARAFAEKGFRCLCYGTDVMLLQQALAEGLAAIRR
ncbi:MAG: HpcH/HpaI aldolase family protein [Pseudomonadota bacterium]